MAQAERYNLMQKAKAASAKRVKENNPEIDNLYLDMNGIIHPCARGQGGMPNPTSEDEIYENIFNYTDKIMRIARPQKVLYLAIDGVAPRAKLNQQRSRRFRSAIEVEEKDKREQDLRNNWD